MINVLLCDKCLAGIKTQSWVESDVQKTEIRETS